MGKKLSVSCLGIPLLGVFVAVSTALAQVEQDLAGSAPAPVAPGTEQMSVTHLLLSASFVVQLVMLLLVLMSVVTWGIIVTKWGQVRRAKAQTEKFSDLFWGSGSISEIHQGSKPLEASPVASVFLAGYRELDQIVRAAETDNLGNAGDLDNLDRALRRAKAEEVNRLEYGTTFLATTASAAPFIGLFGTVWGIMRAFLGLSHVKSSSIQAVAPGIAEALIATAIGLAAAIPAAIAFNYFMQQVKILSRNMDMFSAEFLNIARRHFFK